MTDLVHETKVGGEDRPPDASSAEGGWPIRRFCRRRGIWGKWEAMLPLGVPLGFLREIRKLFLLQDHLVFLLVGECQLIDQIRRVGDGRRKQVFFAPG